MNKQADHLLPLFKGKITLSLLETINHSSIKPYTDKRKEDAELKIRELLKVRNNISKHR
jgi:hypothetical protein